MQKHTRRNYLYLLITWIFGFSVKASEPIQAHRKVHWKKLGPERVGVGDMWAGEDPNTPERQGKDAYNLQMKAVHPDNYGKRADEISIGNGAFWRPVNVVSFGFNS